MPERKVKAIGRTRAGLALILPALAATLALTACLPVATRHSALPPQQVQPLPAPAQPPRPPAIPMSLAEAPLTRPTATLEPYGLTEPPQPTAALAPYGLTESAWPAPEAGFTAAVLETTPSTPWQAPGQTLAELGSLAGTGATGIAPDQTAFHSYHPSPHNYQPGLPSFVFNNGLINQARLMAEPFPGRLFTALAGERLLTAYGLTPTREDETDAEPLPGFEAAPGLTVASLDPAAPVLVAPVPVAPVPAMNAPALDSNIAAPAPSAGVPNLSAGRFRHQGDRTTKLLTAAYEQTGRHYRTGGLNPGSGFDAAGYTHWVFSREGMHLPKTPYGLAKAGVVVTRENLRPGDVLIYQNPTDKVNGWHVGIYSGQGNFLHASPKAGVVTETDAFGPQYAPFFLGGRRFFDDPEAAPLSDTQKMAATSTAVKLALTELGPNDKVAKPKPRPKPAQKAAKPKSKKAVKK
jgi:cell wall-associated NlpC family hydrolase